MLLILLILCQAAPRTQHSSWLLAGGELDKQSSRTCLSSWLCLSNCPSLPLLPLEMVDVLNSSYQHQQHSSQTKKALLRITQKDKPDCPSINEKEWKHALSSSHHQQQLHHQQWLTAFHSYTSGVCLSHISQSFFTLITMNDNEFKQHLERITREATTRKELKRMLEELSSQRLCCQRQDSRTKG